MGKSIYARKSKNMQYILTLEAGVVPDMEECVVTEVSNIQN